MKICEVLRVAAENHLWNGTSQTEYETTTGLYHLPTMAVSFACGRYIDYTHAVGLQRKTFEFLKSLGYETELYYEAGAFNEFAPGEDRQSVKHCWMMFAADIAEEQGK